ncbi:LOG family protein [Nocardia gipuzkoensis]
MARELGHALAERGWAVMTGGGPGIMQAVRDGSGEARSRAVCVQISGEKPETVLDRTRAITVETFALRKLLLIHDSDALFVFPGGIGTFDELFEVLVHQDTGRLAPVPVVLMEPEGGRLWRAWLRFMDEQLLQEGLVSDSILAGLVVARSVDEALTAVEHLSCQDPGRGEVDLVDTQREVESQQSQQGRIEAVAHGTPNVQNNWRYRGSAAPSGYSDRTQGGACAASVES